MTSQPANFYKANQTDASKDSLSDYLAAHLEDSPEARLFLQLCGEYGIMVHENHLHMLRNLIVIGGIDWSLINGYAMEAAAMAPRPTMAYLFAVLRRCHRQGITTQEQADEADEARQRSRRQVYAQQYEQRDYSQQGPEPLPDWLQDRIRRMAGEKERKKVTAQQYEQRDYSSRPATPTPEWMIKGMKELEGVDV